MRYKPWSAVPGWYCRSICSFCLFAFENPPFPWHLLQADILSSNKTFPFLKASPLFTVSCFPDNSQYCLVKESVLKHFAVFFSWWLRLLNTFKTIYVRFFFFWECPFSCLAYLIFVSLFWVCKFETLLIFRYVVSKDYPTIKSISYMMSFNLNLVYLFLLELLIKWGE